ncbi:MAG: tetratricopeptide repeat protein [Candidatus Kapaibacteriota bacterium]
MNANLFKNVSLATFILLITFSSTNLFAEKVEDYIKKGNSLYKDSKYKDAEVQYRKALELDPNSNIAKFNLGTAYYKQGNFQEAMKSFDAVDQNNFNKKNLASAYYNLGNSYLQSKNYKESIDAYKKALANNPKDYDAKYNLEYARRMLQEQQQQQNQQQKQEQKNNQDKNKQQQNKQQQNQQQNQQQQNNKQNQQQDNKNQQQQDNKNQQNENKEQGQDKNKISKKDAERILQALMNEEKKVQKKIKAKVAEKGKLEKNW